MYYYILIRLWKLGKKNWGMVDKAIDVLLYVFGLIKKKLLNV